VTCVHVGAFPPTHNWAKILENCQAKKRPRLIHDHNVMLHDYHVMQHHYNVKLHHSTVKQHEYNVT
jgi:hypothetical protein